MSLETWKAECYPVEAKDCPKGKHLCLAHSLRKWIGLKPDALKKHGVFVNDRSNLECEASIFPIDASTCALCKQYDPSDCYQCPLDSCVESFGAWDLNHDPEPMIAQIEEAMKG